MCPTSDCYLYERILYLHKRSIDDPVVAFIRMNDKVATMKSTHELLQSKWVGKKQAAKRWMV